jgi:hypothetical protein
MAQMMAPAYIICVLLLNGKVRFCRNFTVLGLVKRGIIDLLTAPAHE